MPRFFQRSTPLDTTIRIVTPENIAFSFRLAGPYIRAMAWLLDAFFMILFLGLTSLLLILVAAAIIKVFNVSEETTGKVFLGFYFVIYAIVFWFGSAILEAFWSGRTLGKKLCGIRVLTVDGLPITKYQAFVRNIVRTADLTLGPFLMVFMAGNDRFMRLGDVAAGTFVVQEETSPGRREVISFKDPQITELVRRIPGDFTLSHELVKSLALYVSRRGALSPERRREIATPCATLLLKKMNLTCDCNPDLFLCAVYQYGEGPAA
ncbi:MAG: RDD family protein [Planctomycetia bacterium]|nr:RDD family protein [Planctomycetia bacterium]